MQANEKVESRKDVILDTNILQYILDYPEFKKQVLDHLSVLRAVGSVLYISDYSIFELIDTSSAEEEQRAIETILEMNRFSLDADTLIVAARLGSMYLSNGNISPDEGDKIIAATAINNDCIIYTADRRGFPTPFFTEIDSKQLQIGSSTVKCRFKKPDTVAIARQSVKRAKEFSRRVRSEQLALFD